MLLVEVLLGIEFLLIQLSVNSCMLVDKFSLSSVLNIVSEIISERNLLNESIQCLFLCPSSVTKENSPTLKPTSAVFLSSTRCACSRGTTGKKRLYFLLTRRVGRVITKQVLKRKQWYFWKEYQLDLLIQYNISLRNENKTYYSACIFELTFRDQLCGVGHTFFGIVLHFNVYFRLSELALGLAHDAINVLQQIGQYFACFFQR